MLRNRSLIASDGEELQPAAREERVGAGCSVSVGEERPPTFGKERIDAVIDPQPS